MNNKLVCIFFCIFIANINLFAMQIFINSTDIPFTALEVEANDTIENIKAKIEEKTGILPSKQQLLFSSKKLEEGRTLADYNIQKESILDLIVLKIKPLIDDISMKKQQNILFTAHKVTNLILHGLHGHPLDFREDKNSNNNFWVAGDLGNSGNDSNVDYFRIGEIGSTIYKNTDIQINLSLGKNYSKEKTSSNGYQKINGNFIVLETLSNLSSINKNLWATISFVYNKSDANIKREYLDISKKSVKGSSDIKSYSIRARADLENYIEKYNINFIPFIEFAAYKTNIDSYKESTTQRQSANYDTIKRDSSEIRVGINSNYEIIKSLDLLFGLEQTHLLYESDANISGKFYNGDKFKYNIDKQDKNWTKLNIGFSKTFENSKFNIYYNYSNKNNSFDRWLAFNWSISY
ncbi:hypothetical protein CRU98_02900 [Arcobacter sp. CECT 8986]|uniref:ubiquitin-like protein n=1 Tax=Arcobacter sp. CECT 8986 TaxID=2044507 RepID=UPI001009E3A0|nr:ubiquitin-like protein [Arcobacter sp. CECT 8986]RXK00118.1 hypothetical protein CRU98_02900 [Arcobacter sp. CECT 8986]